MYVDITWQCELAFCNVHSHVKECRADILNICCNYCPRVSALYYKQTVSKWYTSLHIRTLPFLDCTVCILAIYDIFFKYPFKGVASSFFVLIQPSICLPVVVIVITNFCAAVSRQTIAPSTVPSYHILVMTSSRGYGPFCILLCFEVFYHSHLLMCTLSPTLCINELGFLMNTQVFQDVTLVKLSNISKDCRVFIFRVKQFKKSNCTGGIYIYIYIYIT